MDLKNSDKKILLSIVIPVYKAELIVDELVKRLTTELTKITDDYEIILVEDRSPDNSWGKIIENCRRDNHLVGLRLSKNFGQHPATTAGLSYSKGEWVVIMDCDLQNRPEEIKNLFNEALKGNDIVLARRATRKDTFIKRTSSKVFNSVFSYLSDVKQDSAVAEFGIYHHKVIKVLLMFQEPLKAIPQMVQWVGFKKTTIDVVNDERFEGSSSYSWKKLIRLALDISISYSDKPLRLVINLGVFISMSSVIYTLYSFIMYFEDDKMVSGYTSLIISIWFLFGLLIFILGVIGLYIGKIFDGIKKRPIYIIDKEINVGDPS